MNQKPSGWTSPSSLLGIFGFVSIVYSGYLAFQKDVGGDIATLQSRIAVAEARLSALDKQLDQIERRQERGDK